MCVPGKSHGRRRARRAFADDQGGHREGQGLDEVRRSCTLKQGIHALVDAITILDVVSRKWITTLVCTEETATQVEVAFTDALAAEDLLSAHDVKATAALASGGRDRITTPSGDGQLPLLLAISDNGPQMRSHSTRKFLAGVAIAQQFGHPHTPEDQAWIPDPLRPRQG